MTNFIQKTHLDISFIAFNCSLDSQSSLLTSQILVSCSKFKWSNRAYAVYWLCGTLLCPCYWVLDDPKKKRIEFRCRPSPVFWRFWSAKIQLRLASCLLYLCTNSIVYVHQCNCICASTNLYLWNLRTFALVHTSMCLPDLVAKCRLQCRCLHEPSPWLPFPLSSSYWMNFHIMTWANQSGPGSYAGSNGILPTQ